MNVTQRQTPGIEHISEITPRVLEAMRRRVEP